MENHNTMECKSCGANLSFDSSSVSKKCSFCGSEYFLEVPETQEQKEIKENAEIILFKVQKDEAGEKFAEWIKKGLFKPSDLATAFQEQEFDGAYIPFYKVSSEADTNWDGQDKVKYGDGPDDFDWEDSSGTHSETYKDFVAATKGLDQDEVDDILPFDDNDTKPYSQELMMGYKFENPAISEENAIEKGRDRVKEWEREACTGKCDNLIDYDVSISNIRSKLMMLPIWVLVYTFENKPYRVLINGQTGKVSGQKPVSKLKVAIAIALAVAVGVGIYFGYQAMQ